MKNTSNPLSGHPPSNSPQADLWSRFYNAFSEAEIRRLRAIAPIQRVAAHQTFMREGDVRTCVFMIKDGCAKAYKALPDGRIHIVGFLFPGDILGFSPHDQYTFSVESLTEMKVRRVKCESLAEFVHTSPAIADSLFRIIIGEMVLAHERLLMLGCKDATEKVASLLLDMANRQSNKWNRRIQLPMSRTDIADYLGLSIETVSRSFSKLKNAGIISVPNSSSVTVSDMRALESASWGLCQGRDERKSPKVERTRRDGVQT